MSKTWSDDRPAAAGAWEAALAGVRADDTYPMAPPWTVHIGPAARVLAAAWALARALSGLRRKGG